MNALRNKVQLIGNLGNNPEVKSLDGGKKVARFNVATSESYRNTTKHPCKLKVWLLIYKDDTA